MMDRRLKYRRRHRKAGLCEQCPAPPAKGDRLCAACREAERDRDARYRRTNGAKRWKPGSRGRPPVWWTKAKTTQDRQRGLERERVREFRLAQAARAKQKARSARRSGTPPAA